MYKLNDDDQQDDRHGHCQSIITVVTVTDGKVPDTAPAYNTVIEEGMIFTIEPMLTLGTIEWDMWEDDWTVVTRDRKRSAQFEHTMVVTSDGVDILTLP